MLRSSKCVLISRLRFSSLIRECFKSAKGKRTLYWDPYSKDLDIFTSVMLAVCPRDLIAIIYSSFFRFFGVTLLPVPHADKVENYHTLQLNAENETRLLLATYLKNAEFDATPRYKNFDLDQDCLASLSLQQEGLTLYCLIENVKVLKTIGFKAITIELSKGSYSSCLREIFIQEYSVILEDSRCSFSPFTGLAVSLFLLWVTLKDYILDVGKRIVFQNLPNPNIVAQNPIIAVEFVDPLLFSGLATEPNYLVKHGYDKESVFFYSRSNQFKNLWNGAYRHKKNPMHINLTRFPSGIQGLKIQVKLFCDVIKSLTNGSISISSLGRDLALLRTYKDLESLFSFLPIKAHLYNIIPNGRVSTRFDSGLVTGVCRKFGIRSFSYQSRVMYRHNLYYHFNVFDIYFFWGSAWADEYKLDQFIKKYQIIGNVNNFVEFDALEKNKILSPEHSESIAIFPSDINSKIAFHYTEDYTRKFLTACFESIGKVQQTEKKIFKVYIKFKEERHKNWFYQHSELSEIAVRCNLSIVVDDSKKYDVQSLINSVSRVISIGFTTPGFDAICLGKNSIFFTPYNGVYNGIFNETSPLVANSAEDLVNFLSKGFDYSAFEIQRDAILGVCQSEASGTKLCGFIKNDLRMMGDS